MDWTPLESGLVHSDNDKRIHALHQLQQLLSLNPNDQPVSRIDHLVDELKPLVKNGNRLVSNSATACLPPLFQTPSWPTAAALKHAIALLVPWDKLADAKPNTRQLAARTVVNASRAALRFPLLPEAAGTLKESPWTAIEAGLRGEFGFASKNARAREQACLVLAALRAPDPLCADSQSTLPPLRPFTPVLLPLLADADPAVRAAALETTLAVFSHPSVSDAARADLKKELQRIDISRRIQDQILAHVLGGGVAQSSSIERSESHGSLSAQSASDHSATSAAAGARPLKLARSPASSASPLQTPSLLASLPPPQQPDPSVPTTTASAEISPVYVASERDLDAEFVAMRPAFEGRESEHNWMARDRSVAKIRGMLLGGVANGPLQAAFVRNVREVQDGIIKTASSLRTTVALSALALISELASTLAPSHAVEALLDGFLSHCLSMAGQTKKIVASGSQATVTTLLEHSNYHLRTVQLVCALLGEKTASARQFGAQHVLTLLRVHTDRSKHALDSTGGTGELENAVRRGLADANPQVREVSRVAFWEFERGWPDRAASVATALDASGRKLLDKARPAEGESHQQLEAVSAPPVSSPARPGPADAGPSSPAVNSPARVRAPAAGGAGAGTGAKKPSVREAMMAARKKMLADKENGTAPASKDGFIAFGDTPLAPPVPVVPDSPNGAGLETPTRFRNPAQPAFSPESPASPSRNRDEISPRPSSRALSSVLPEPIVDDALREQARQAELAAERLLELSLDEAESDTRETETLLTTITPRSDRRVARTPRTAGPGALAGGGAAPFSTPLPNPALRHLARVGDAGLFKDSPDPRDPTGAAAGRGGWWARGSQGQAVNRGAKSATPLDDAERAEVAQAVSALQAPSGGFDVAALRRLSQFSRERPSVETLDAREGLSPVASSREHGDSNADSWQEDRLFDRVYSGLRSLLLRSDPAPSEAGLDAALRLLKDLAENQSPCFVGAEAGLFELLFKMRENPSRGSIAATELVATSFADRLEPVYGLGVFKPALTKYLSTPSAPSPGSFALGLRLIGSLYEKLPDEVLEDVLPQHAEILQRALNDSESGDLRRAAIMTLVAAQASLRASSAAGSDEGDGFAAQKLDELVGGLRPDQRNLVAYYSSRRKR